MGDVAGVYVPPSEPASDESDVPTDRDDDHRLELDRAIRKALGMVVLAGIGVAVLLLTHPEPSSALVFEGEATVFTVGVLLIAGYGGYRLGQWEKYRAVARVLDEIDERTPPD